MTLFFDCVFLCSFIHPLSGETWKWVEKDYKSMFQQLKPGVLLRVGHGVN